MGSEKIPFYVAVNGNDKWSGTIDAPDSSGSDGPLATLAGARDAVLEYRKENPGRDTKVLIRGGTYYLDQTVVFGLEDSASDCTVTYEAYPDETPVFSSGKKLTGFRKLDKAPEALPEAARDKVWVADIPEDWDRFCTLYDGDRRLPRACSEATAPTNAFDFFNEGVPIEPGYVWPPYDELHFPEGFLKNWDNLDDVEIVIRPHNLWVVNILGLKEVDEKKCIARTKIKGSYPLGMMIQGDEEEQKRSLWLENALEVLDKPGEWVLNMKERKLYLWPEGDEPGNDLTVPTLMELVRVEGDIDYAGPEDKPVRNIVFRGLAFTQGDRDTWTKDDICVMSEWEVFDKGNALLRFRGAEDCVVDRCRFFNSGSTAVRLDLHCQECVVSNNVIEDVGGTGIFLCGYGPGHKYVNKKNLVYNNTIQRCGTIYGHSIGIFLWQSGENRVANNLVCHVPYIAIAVCGVRNFFFDEPFKSKWRENSPTIRWNEVGNAVTWERVFQYMHSKMNVIEDNEVHHALETLSDGNGIYFSCTGPFNVLRRNFLHDIGLGMGARDLPRCAFRTDGWQRDTLITENIFYKCRAGVQRKNYNHVENNYFIDTQDPGRCIVWASFPEDEPSLNSRVQRNIMCTSDAEASFYAKFTYRGIDKVTWPKDCYVDYNLLYSAGNPEFAQDFLKQWQEEEQVDLNGLAADPMFVDPGKGDFTLKPGSPALKLGIKQIDFRKIGLRSR